VFYDPFKYINWFNIVLFRFRSISFNIIKKPNHLFVNKIILLR